MSLLVRSQLRFVRHAPWSAATALLGVALGVASVVAVHLIGAAVVQSLEQNTPLHLNGLTHVLERPDLDADAYFDLRERWRRHPQSAVTALVPVVEGHVTIGQRRVPLLGADWLAMPAAGADASVAVAAVPDGGGGPLAVSADVLLGAAVVADPALGYRIGRRLQIGEGAYRVDVVRPTGLGGAVIADIAAAQQMLGAGPAVVHRIGLAVTDPWQPWRTRLDRLMPGFAAGLPPPRQVDLADLIPGPGHGVDAGWRVLPVVSQQPSAEFARAVLFNLGSLGTLALLVAWFLIYQVGVIWLRRQHLLLERLHAVGVSHVSLRRSFLAVFVTLGALATALGTALGVALAGLLTDLTAGSVEAAERIRTGFGAVDLWVLIKAVISGLGVCLLGGLAAFAREWREAPWSPWWRLLAPVLLAVMVGGIVLDESGVLGGFLAILALSLLGVALVPPALALLRRLVLRLRGGLLVRLALRDVAWYPRMVAVALAALSLAVATSIGIGVMVESFRLDFERMLGVRLAGDLYLNVAYADAGEVQAWLAANPEVARLVAYGRDRVRVSGVPVELGYSRFDAAESRRYGHSRPLGPGEALISERLARDLDVGPGDAVDAAQGSLTVVGTFPGFGDPLGRLLVDVASLDSLGLAPMYDRITVHLGPSADRGEELTARLERRFASVTVEPRAGLRDAVLGIFDRTFAITHALTLVALLVAVVGTYNALTALRLHQNATAELLRAQGMTARELGHIALLRAGAVGAVAMTLALPLGLAMAWMLCAVINPRSFGWTVDLHLPASAWLPPLGLGVLAALVAGALPAPRERGMAHEAA